MRFEDSPGAEVSIALVDEDSMRQLNMRFRKIDKATDVLAFDLSDGGELSGEVVISPQVAAGQAADEGIDVGEEIRTLLIHGLLHLLGYDHELEENAEKMFNRQEELKAGFQREKGL